MKDTSTFALFLDKIKRHQLRQPLKAALAVVPSLAFAVRPRQPQKHVVPALCFEKKKKVRHNHQTILTLSYISTSTNLDEILRDKMNQADWLILAEILRNEKWTGQSGASAFNVDTSWCLSKIFDVLQCLPATSTSESFCSNICTWWHLHAKRCKTCKLGTTTKASSNNLKLQRTDFISL